VQPILGLIEHARARPFEHRSELTLQRFAIDSREFILAGEFLPRENVEAYATTTAHIIEQIAPLFERPWKTLRLHGDCHLGNVLWGNGAPILVDFDDSLTGPAMQDLWMLLSGEREEMEADLADYLAGYTEFMDFDATELRLIEPLRTLRLLRYAAWLAQRWHDPAFPRTFPWFTSNRYWEEQILALKQQLALLEEPPLVWQPRYD